MQLTFRWVLGAFTDVELSQKMVISSIYLPPMTYYTFIHFENIIKANTSSYFIFHIYTYILNPPFFEEFTDQSHHNVNWVSCHHGMEHPQVADGGEGLQIWRVAVNIFYNQS
jgi:hypothetical protein